MTPTLFDLALKAGFSDPIDGWMGEAYEERLEAFAKLIIDHEIATKIANVTGELMDKSVALETVYETIIHWDEGGGKRSRRELARRIVDLYTTPPAAPVQEPVAWPAGLIDRIKAAEKRIQDGHAPRRIPADVTDVDLVLAEVRYLLEGKQPPFWIKDTPPAAQRQPLTDEQIRDLWSWSATAEAERTATTQQHAFARAIEAAHGIR